MATGRSELETVVVKVSILAIRKRAAGFSNVKSIADIVLELVHRLAVGMSSYGVSEIGT